MTSQARRLARRERTELLLDLGTAVTERRRELSRSQHAAAEIGGLHRNYLGAVERGEVNPTYATLVRVSRGLDLEPSQLVARAFRARRSTDATPGPRKRGRPTARAT